MIMHSTKILIPVIVRAEILIDRWFWTWQDLFFRVNIFNFRVSNFNPSECSIRLSSLSVFPNVRLTRLSLIFSICDHEIGKIWGDTCLSLPPLAWTDGRIALSVVIRQLLLKFKIPFPRVTFENVGSWSMHLVARLVLSLIEYTHPTGDQIYSSASTFQLLKVVGKKRADVSNKLEKK